MSSFKNIFDRFMSSIILEAKKPLEKKRTIKTKNSQNSKNSKNSTTKTERDQILSLITEKESLIGLDDFFILLPNGNHAGPFDSIIQVGEEGRKSCKSCKADVKFYNLKNPNVKELFISLKDYSFRQFGGSQDLFGQKITWKTTKMAAKEILNNNPFIKSKYDLIKNVFDKVKMREMMKLKRKFNQNQSNPIQTDIDQTNLVQTDIDQINLVQTDIDQSNLDYDFYYLRGKIDLIKTPNFSFEIPDDLIGKFLPCKFGYEMLKATESSYNNVDVILAGKPGFEQISGNLLMLKTTKNGGIEWNPKLYDNNQNVDNENYKMYLCFNTDTEKKHRFGEFLNCRFGVWPKEKTTNWIHEDKIKEFLNRKNF